MVLITDSQLDLVEECAKMQCTPNEIARLLGVTPSQFMTVIKENELVRMLMDQGRAEGTMSIRRKQFEIMDSGNAQMAIFLGKNYCEQTDKIDTSSNSVIRHEICDNDINDVKEIDDC